MTSYQTADYDYALPAAAIAQHPAERRDASRLMVLTSGGEILHRHFTDLPTLLKPGDLLVANDTRVLPARFFAKRRCGGACELLLLHPSDGDTWEALARPGKRVRVGDIVTLGDEAVVEIVGRTAQGTRIVQFHGLDAAEAMERFGHVPLPPYIASAPDDARERYQTIYAARAGSAAAPTAGLHFSQDLLLELRRREINWATLTLHVGAGTFRPVKSRDIRDHVMHKEYYEISEATAAHIRAAKAGGGRVIAVGTTSLRALEDAGGKSAARWTDLFIYEPFSFRVVDLLITNFHLPRSTLLMLVCAFAGRENVLAAYEKARDSGYRFFSFGDAMLIEGRAA